MPLLSLHSDACYLLRLPPPPHRTSPLQVPLADGADILGAYEAWEGGRQPSGWELPEEVRREARRAAKGVQLRQPYEEAVAAGKPADADLLAAYMAYIKVEQTDGEPQRVQVGGPE